MLPVRPRDLVGSSWVGRVLSTVSASWVVDRGAGPVAYVSASSTAATDAGHLGSPIAEESVDPAALGALVRTAIDWLAARGAPRIVALVPEANAAGRAALAAAGFRPAIQVLTLYREIA